MEEDKSYDWALGYWIAIHTTAAAYKNRFIRPYFIDWLKKILHNLRCKKCITHALEYLEKHPIEMAENPLLWTIDFHNNVNKRLGKPELTHDEALNVIYNCKYDTYNKKWQKGIYDVMHITAIWAQDKSSDFFSTWIKLIFDKLPCARFKSKSFAYANDHPPENALDDFTWSFHYHNAMNAESGKPHMDFNSVKLMYNGGTVSACEHCGH